MATWLHGYMVTLVRLTFHERSEMKRHSRTNPETSGWLHGYMVTWLNGYIIRNPESNSTLKTQNSKLKTSLISRCAVPGAGADGSHGPEESEKQGQVHGVKMGDQPEKFDMHIGFFQDKIEQGEQEQRNLGKK